jgi:C4-dicarboxylate transporter
VGLTILSSDVVIAALEKGMEILTYNLTDNVPSANAKRVAFESLKRSSPA